MNSTPETITLYYRAGSSDKVYQAWLEPVGELWIVRFAYGRRGATLTTGTKTSQPFDYPAAKKLYDGLVREKQAKGYTPGEEGTPYQHTDKEARQTGIVPQLLNPISEVELAALMNDDTYCLQEKLDGQRVLIRKQDGTVSGINRKGLVIGLPKSLVAEVQKLSGDLLLDGECIGEVYHAFDLLERNGDLRSGSYAERYLALENLVINGERLRVVPTVWTRDMKIIRLATLREAQCEGVVLKRINAPFTPGRPASGGSQLKHKFYATVSAVVTSHNPQRSVELRLWDEGSWQTAGHVTIPPNHPVPPVGATVEVRYLYAFRESGCLYQPVYLGARPDVDPAECVASQLKFKSEEN